MFLLVLIAIFFYQASNFNALPQQFLFFTLLLLLYNRKVPNIKVCDEQDTKIISSEKDHLINSCLNNDENILIDGEEPTVKCDTYKTQETSQDRTFRSAFCDYYNNDPYYKTLNYKTNSCVNPRHYYDTKIYYKKKHVSSNHDDKTQNTNDDIYNISFANKELEIKTNSKSVVSEKNNYSKPYEHNDGNLQHNKMISTDNCKTDSYLKDNKDIDNFAKLNSDSGDCMNSVINKFSPVNKEQGRSAGRNEKVCNKNAVLRVIKKKYLGKTISIIFGDFGLITGTVIFSSNNITGLRLENGIEIYLNNNDIKVYY